MTTDNLIVIKGGAYADVKKALRQWVDNYSEKLQDDFIFKLFTNGRGKHAIQADERLDNSLFYYLVNYLDYPEGITYKIDLEGFTIGKEDNILKGKNLLVYISSTDKDGDNVFVTTPENENFKVNFSGKIIKTNEIKNYNQPIDLMFERQEILKVNKIELKQMQKRATKHGIDKRFKIISIIFVILFLSTYVILSVLQDKVLFFISTMCLNYCVWLWFFFDYEMLRENKFYLRCFKIAVLCGIYGIILDSLNGNGKMELTALGVYPLTFLMLRIPIRRAYLKLFKIEPKIDRSGNDGVYTLILFVGTTILPILIML
jgi:hypothetical protein